MSMLSKQCDDLRKAADEGYCPNRDRILMRNAADTIELLSAKVSDGYIEWLEEKLLDYEPDILCDVVSNECGEWCEDNCRGMRQECLKKCYELCKVEVER